MKASDLLKYLPSPDANATGHGLDLTKVYRSYKNSPHNVDALYLKYLVHRLENGKKYQSVSPEEQQEMDRSFLEHHQRGKAAEKNGHINTNDLKQFIQNPDTIKLAKQLVNHKQKLNNFILKEHPDHIVDINGEPHLRLTRGLGVNREQRGEEHALASYADQPNPPFGGEKRTYHHQHVPLKNIWFTFDYGPKDASSQEYGPENEFVVSPHKIIYNENHDADPTTQILARRHHKLTATNRLEFASIRGKLSLQEIDAAVQHGPDKAAQYLKNHPLLNQSHIDKISINAPIEAAAYLKNHKDFNSGHIDNIIAQEFSGGPAAAAKFLKNHPLLNEQHIDKIIEKRPDFAAFYLKNHPLLNEQHIDKIIEKDPDVAAVNLSTHPSFNQSHINNILGKSHYLAAKYLKNHKDFNVDHINKIIKKDPFTAAEHLKDHPLLNEQHIDRIVETAPSVAARFLSNHPIYKAKYGNMQKSFKQLTKEYERLTKADGSEQLNFSSNTEMLRKLRDSIQKRGGVVNAKDLSKLGFNENSLKINHLKDSNGNYTSAAIQQHIDNQPKHTYHFSYTKWKKDQRHSEETQHVFRLDYTPEMKQQLKEAGVLDTFEKAYKTSFESGHPVKKNTLGWVRYTQGGDKHIHVDEIQSDFGHGLFGKIDAPKEKIDKMNEILFKGHYPSKLLHEAFLQHLRNQGHVGREIHIWQAIPKAKLADQKTEISPSDYGIRVFINNHKKIENNQFDKNTFDDSRKLAILTLGEAREHQLSGKHFKSAPSSDDTPEAALNRQNYINEFVNSKPYQLILNHLKAHQTNDTLESALEHLDIKNKNVRIPYTHNELPVHMKIGYHETPIKMGYEADSYGKTETQKNKKLANQPTWKQPLRKSFKQLTKEYERLTKADAPVKINPEHGRMIADAYHNMKHDPNHPEVKAAYNALISETNEQYKNLLQQGYKFTRITDPNFQPYKNSKEMHADIENNKHLYYYPTSLGFGSEDSHPKDHPLLAPTEFVSHDGEQMVANDVLRQVHDINGHYHGGKTSFGPVGEHQSYLHHKKMYSTMAQPALANELTMQNSWVNFGPHGEHNRKNPLQTIFAPQKAGLVPDWVWKGKWHQ